MGQASGDSAATRPGRAPTPQIRLQVRPAPALDPPFDSAGGASAGGSMDMLPLPRPAHPQTSRHGRGPLSRRPAGRRDRTTSPEAVSPPEQAGTCSGRAAVRRLMSICVEIINGYRPVSHLRPLTEPQCLATASDQLLRRTSGARTRTRMRQAVRIRRIRVTEPATGVVEAAVVLDQSDTCFAMAIRLQRTRHGWQCHVLQVI
ncbi:MAG: hypothetical protein KJO75_24205 [Dactylosporangium sp.]|nr:hypothetical protein [Dactylosporangium sp.]